MARLEFQFGSRRLKLNLDSAKMLSAKTGINGRPILVAQKVLDSMSPVDVATRRVEYQKTGWKQFDPAASDYTLSEAELGRARRRGL